MVGIEEPACCPESKPALAVAVYASIGQYWKWLVLSWEEFSPYMEVLFLCAEVFFPCAVVFYPCVEVFFLCGEVFFACRDICSYDQKICLFDGVCRGQGNFENLFSLDEVVYALSHRYV